MDYSYQRRRAAQGRATPSSPAPAAPQYRSTPNSAFPAASQGGMGKDAMREAMRSRMSGLFGQTYENARAETEADRIGGLFSNASGAEDLKAKMGDALGADFSGVRFHTGAEAVAKANAVEARAYTSGSDVYFGEGGYDTSVAAHELVHTAQQGAAPSAAALVSAPMGSVQRIPKWLKAVGKGVMGLGRAATFIPRKIGQGLAGAKEIVSGKILNPLGRKIWNGIGFRTWSQYQANKKAANGDYSEFANLRKKDAQRYVDEQKEAIRNRAEVQGHGAEDFADVTTSQMVNPAYRKALSQLAKEDADLGAEYEKAGELMDQKMMKNTIIAPNKEMQEQNLTDYYKEYGDQQDLSKEYSKSTLGKMALGSEATGFLPSIWKWGKAKVMGALGKLGVKRSESKAQTMAQKDMERSQASGDVLLRTMLLMQMGNFKRRDTDPRTGEKTDRLWDKSMANAFSHGGRTAFLFHQTDADTGANTDDVTEALFGENMGKGAGVEKRAAATHGMKMPTLGEDGSLDISKYKEKHGNMAQISGMFTKGFHNFGMDMAIGGAGQRGINGHTINADGRSGHMYIGRQKSTATKGGGLLMGLESDSPYRMNQTGHMHNAAAVAEEGSSTGGLKVDAQGDKYTGRTVDLTKISNQDVSTLLNRFTSHVNTLRNGNEQQQAQYQNMVDQIIGGRMNNAQMRAMLGGIAGNDEDAEFIQRLMEHREDNQ